MRHANDALQDMMELINMPDFENREGWKQKSANKNDIVYSKHYAIGKVFTMRVSFFFLLFSFLILNIEFLDYIAIRVI